MSEEEHIALSEQANEFWLKYSRLVGESLSKCPPHLRDIFLAMMQDKSSVYGSVYERYMKGDSGDRHEDDGR